MAAPNRNVVGVLLMYVSKKILALVLGLAVAGAAGAGLLYLQLDQANADLRSTRADLRQTAATLEASTVENARLNDVLTDANADLRATRSTLQQTAVTLDASKTETTGLSDALAEANASIDAMNAEVAKADARVAAASAEVVERKAAVTELTEELDALSADYQDLQRLYEKISATYRDLQGDFRSLERDNGRLHDRITNLQNISSDTQDRFNEKINALRKEYNAQVSAVRIELATARREMEELRASYEARLAEFEALQRLTTPPLDEERTIMLPLGGETKLMITRELPGHVLTMDLLERSVRVIEDFMGAPLPERRYGADYVDYRFHAELEACGGYLGYFRFSHIVTCVDENTQSQSELISVMAHETAHYYWNGRAGTPKWFYEGAAEFLEYIVKGNLDPVFTRRPCELADNIAEFLRLAAPASAPPDWEAPYFRAYHNCEYGLGEHLFHALYHGTDDATFRAAFRDLYQNAEQSAPPSMRAALRDAFARHADADQLAVVDRILEERYGPSTE